ncbi:MAG: hypothetical protein KKA28_05505 [Planctomycetes bacterium]|nr:hypothetical protein [Planctomycetota bacterium]MCG2684989.1 hypothetical protein [Planctomycetales bacterium]
MKTAIFCVFVLCVPLTWTAGTASAGEEPLRFLQVLRENGYGDMAVEYLRILDNRPDLPQEVRGVWDLEMSKSLRAAAADAFDARDYERLTAESQKHLAKFIREKPDHPAVASAITSWGEFLGQQALNRLGAAKSVAGKDKLQHEKFLADAREDLKLAREKFIQAQQYLQKQLAALPPPKQAARGAGRGKAAEARAETEANLLEARFQTAMADYYLAQAYSDPNNKERTDALHRAAKGFDDIFQQDRTSGAMLTLTGLRAHLWQGKTAEELGDLRLAADIYDEVLVGAAEPGQRRAATGLEPLFARVEYFRMLILAKQKPDQFLAEAVAWLEQNRRRLRQTEGYQGIALETAKAIHAKAQKAAGAEKAKGASESLRILAEMSRIRSPHQQDAILLRRDLLLASGKSDLEVGTFEEAVALAAAAVADAQWEQARNLYKKALEIADQTKLMDEARIAAAGEALAGAELMLAGKLFSKGKLEQCIEAVGRIVYEDQDKKIVRKDSDAAAQAAALAVGAALNLYVNATDDKKPDALKRLTQLAEFTESNWPGRPEADDARMARGQAELVVNRVQEAIDIFERVNPKSARYPQAMYFVGQNYARLYLVEKNKPDDLRDESQVAAYRDRVVERLRAGLSVLAKQVEPGRPLPDYFLETQLLLAEIRADGGEQKEAAELYQPLIDIIKADKPRNFDRTTVRVFLGAVRAYTALGQFDKAGKAADVLIELGPDSPQVNDVLIRFAGLLDLERKKASAAVTELETTTKDAETKAAKQQLAKVQNLLGDILGKLAGRKELSLWAVVFIADGLNSLGMTAEASRKYQEIIRHAETDPEFAKSAKKAMTRVRAQLIGLLRKEGKFAEALEQVDQLIEDNPRALEPLMEKGRILEGWAEKEPAKFGHAVAHWVMLRNRLQPMRKKPAEYYDVMYNVAACLVREAEHGKDKATVMDRAKKAEQVLKAALILSPKLNGPDTVARYKVLLNKAITMQGRTPEK